MTASASKDTTVRGLAPATAYVRAMRAPIRARTPEATTSFFALCAIWIDRAPTAADAPIRPVSRESDAHSTEINPTAARRPKTANKRAIRASQPAQPSCVSERPAGVSSVIFSDYWKANPPTCRWFTPERG